MPQELTVCRRIAQGGALLVAADIASLCLFGISITLETLLGALCGVFVPVVISLNSPIAVGISGLLFLVAIPVCTRKSKAWWLPVLLWPMLGAVALRMILARTYRQ